MVEYPVLAGEIAKRGIKKCKIARSIDICDRALTNRLSGKVPFTLPEVFTIRDTFFPEMTIESLFQKTGA